MQPCAQSCGGVSPEILTALGKAGPLCSLLRGWHGARVACRKPLNGTVPPKCPAGNCDYSSRWPRSRALHPKDSCFCFLFDKEPVLVDVEVPGREQEPASPAPGPVPAAGGSEVGRAAVLGEEGPAACSWWERAAGPRQSGLRTRGRPRGGAGTEAAAGLSWPRGLAVPRPDFLGCSLGLANG